MNRVVLLSLFTSLVFLGSCTSTTAPGVKEAEPVASEAPAPYNLPDVNLTQDILFRILSAEIAGQRGFYDVAVKNYMRVATQTRDPRVAEHATRIAVMSRDDLTALEAANLWVELASDNIDARQFLAVLLLRNKRLNDAVEQFEVFLGQSTDKPDQGYLSVVQMLARERDKEGAMAVMDQLMAKRQENAFAQFAMAHFALRKGQLSKAEEAVNKALLLQPDWSEAVVLKSRVLQVLGNSARATDYLASVLKGGKLAKDVAVRMTYARLLMDAKELDQALDQFELLAKQEPKDADILYTCGMVSVQLQRWSKAEGYLKRLIDLDRRVFEASYYLGQIAEFNQKPQQAVEWYSRITSGNYYLNAQMHIAKIFAQQGDINKAREHLNSVQVYDNDDRVQLILLEADILGESGAHQESFDLLSEALLAMPEERELLYARALMAEKLDFVEIAEDDLRKILKMDPDNVQALNALGYTLADRTDRFNEALVMVRRALELEPQDPAIMDSMGWVQFRLGNFQDSVKYLRKALELHDDAEIAAHLGEVLWVMGNREDAITVWQTGLKSSPKSAVLLDIMKRFGL